MPANESQDLVGQVLSVETPGGATTRFEIKTKLPSEGAALYDAVTGDGRVAIVKAPRSAGAKDPALEREARQLALVAPHPGFPRLLAKQREPKGSTILVLERLFENPLLALNRPHVRERLQQKAPSPPGKTAALAKPRRIAPPLSVALELGYELALALEHLHLKSIVHGDVKPENLLVAIDWKEPAIPDSIYFDRIARGRFRGVLTELGGSRTTKELEGLARGLPLVEPPRFTPLYAPPEVVPGQRDGTGQEKPRYGLAMDIYSFGLTLYELVTGCAPYAHLRFPPNDPKEIEEAKRQERGGEQRPIHRSALDALDWSDSTVEDAGREAALDKKALVDELWELLARATHLELPSRGRMGEIRGLLAKLLRAEAIAPEKFAGDREAASDDPRTWRNWTQKRLRIDAFSSRLTFAGRDGTQTQKDPKTLKIQRRGSDFWEQQGLGGTAGGGAPRNR